jgi:hypothetical protein
MAETDFEKQEKQVKQERINDENTALTQKTVKIYWASARGYQLGSFKKEIRDGSGNIIETEVPLRWYDHTLTTDNPAAIDYIEKSDGFRTNAIKLCKTMGDARLLTKAQLAVKSGSKEFTSEINEDKFIEIKSEGNVGVTTQNAVR